VYPLIFLVPLDIFWRGRRGFFSCACLLARSFLFKTAHLVLETMADLNNLLGELDEPQEDEQDDLSVGNDGGDESSDRLPEEDAYNDQRQSAERAELPAALREAERLRHAQPPPGGFDDGFGDAYGGGLTGEATAAGLNAAPDDDEDADAGAAEDDEYAALKTLWTQELLCPELLPRDDATLASQLELLRTQEDTIDDLQERVASGDSSDGADPLLASLAAGIYKMESDRVRFLLADLTRTRLAKIENHALHNRELVDRMSAEEVEYLKTYGGSVERHFNRTVLNAMPKEAWRKLNEPDMIDSPDLDAYVFCKVLETVEIDSSTGDKKKKKSTSARDEDDSDEDDDDEMGSSIQEHTAGSFLIARYATIQKHVLEGRIVLLV